MCQRGGNVLCSFVLLFALFVVSCPYSLWESGKSIDIFIQQKWRNVALHSPSPHQIIRAAVVSDELLHALQWLHQFRLLRAPPLTPHLLCHTIDGNQDAACLP